MSILDKIFGGRKPHEQDDIRQRDAPMAMDSTGDLVYEEDLVGYITQELEKRRDERGMLELQWTLNANFVAGHQNCDINIYSRRIDDELIPTRTDNERRVYNRIAPLMETRHANLKSVNYDMVVEPRSAEMDDYAKAKVSTKLLMYCQGDTDFQAKKDKLIAWAELTGTAFTLSYWDPNRGDLIANEAAIVDENGEIVQPEKPLRTGGLDFGLVSSYEVFPASLCVQEIRDQHDIIIEQVRDVGEIYDLYGIKLQGKTMDTYVLTPMANALTGHGRSNMTIGMGKESVDDVEKVITYLENPSRDFPKGRLIIIIRDAIVYYGDLPAGEMPLVAVKSKPVAGQFFGKSPVQDLIPLQRTYNRIVNKIQDYIDTIAANPLIAPEGSIANLDELDATGVEPGTILIYRNVGDKPSLLQYPDLPSTVLSERDHIASDMEYVAGVSQLMVVGATPSGVTSGTAIDNLRQIDNTRMSLTADNIRDAVLAMAKVWLRINKAYSKGYRTMQITGSDDVGYVYTWCSEDINSYDVRFTAENELRHSKDQQRQDFVQALQIGAFADDNGQLSKSAKQRARELFLGDGLSNDAFTLDELQRKNAGRENTFLEQGVIPERYRYDDDAIHLEEHKKYALSMDYRLLMKAMPQYAAAFEAHIDEHEQALAQKESAMMAQMMAAQGGANNAG